MASDNNSVEENASQLDSSSSHFPLSVRRDVLATDSQHTDDYELANQSSPDSMTGRNNRGLVLGGAIGVVLFALLGGYFLVQGNSHKPEESSQQSGPVSESPAQSISSSDSVSTSASSLPQASTNASFSAPAVVEVPVEEAPVPSVTDTVPTTEATVQENPLVDSSVLPTEITAEEAFALASESALPLEDSSEQATTDQVVDGSAYPPVEAPITAPNLVNDNATNE